MLPSGDGATLTKRACGSCHSLGHFIALRQVRRGWANIVRQMVSHGAKIGAEESDVITEYLADVFGPDSPPLVDANRSPKDDLKKLPGVDDATVEKVLQFRKEKGRFENIKQVQEILGSEAFERAKGYLTVR